MHDLENAFPIIAQKTPGQIAAAGLLGHRFSLEEKRRNFKFYYPPTTGDSALDVEIRPDSTAYTLREGGALTIRHDDERSRSRRRSSRPFGQPSSL